MGKQKKKQKKRGNPLWTLVFLAALAVFCFSGYKLIGIYLDYKTGTDEYRDLQQYTTEITKTPETPATPSTPETETPATETEAPKTVLVKEAQTKVLDLGYAQYLVVAFEEGYDVENCSVAVDGVDITGAMTKVTDDGSIVKWELTGLNPAKLVVTKKDDQKTQDVVLSDNENPDKPVVKLSLIHI